MQKLSVPWFEFDAWLDHISLVNNEFIQSLNAVWSNEFHASWVQKYPKHV